MCIIFSNVLRHTLRLDDFTPVFAVSGFRAIYRNLRILE